MNFEMIRRSENLCKIFGIPSTAVGEHADKAAVILNALYGMPAIVGKAERRNFGNNLLASTRSAFRENSDFVYGLGRNVIMMQEFPYFYENLNLTTEKLVNRYVDLERLVFCLTILGFGAGTKGLGLAWDGGVKAFEQNSFKAGARHVLNKISGRDGILGVLLNKYGSRMNGGIGILGSTLIVGGIIVYDSATQQLLEIRNILVDKSMDGKMTDDQYKSVFGKDFNLSDIKKYWEE